MHSQANRVRRRRMLGQLIDGDAVHLRNIAEPDRLSDDQLKHLAILGCSVCHSHALVPCCLDQLVGRQAADPDLPGRYVDALPLHLQRIEGE